MLINFLPLKRGRGLLEGGVVFERVGCNRGFMVRLQNEKVKSFRNLCLSTEDNILSNSENKPRGLYFSKAVFEWLIFGGLIFGGAYLWREICVSKSVEVPL